MIHRYLGKKTAILGPLTAEISRHASPGDHVVDAFSGSLSVSLAMKAAGYRVTANDANLFSYMLAQAYLLPTKFTFADADLLPRRRHVDMKERTRATLTQAAEHSPGFTSMSDRDSLAAYTSSASLVTWLNHVASGDLPKAHRRSHFFDTYTEAGENSAYRSSRGSEGRRRFLIPSNAQRLDLAINQIRAWRQTGLGDPQTGFLLSAVMRAVEKVANTQGTYHDFPRDTWDSRALNPIEFRPQPPDVIPGAALTHRAGKAEDTLDFIRDVGPHAVLYLDPPYNFRQYSAYYFLLNVISSYPDMSSPDDYFANVSYVRGQNPQDNFTSSFCKQGSFLTDMTTLIERAKAKAVIISYFTGRNHWSNFDQGRSDTGRDLIESLLSGAMFIPGTLRVREVERRNYASYGGYRARNVHELIMTAEKRRGGLVEREAVSDRGLSTVA